MAPYPTLLPLNKTLARAFYVELNLSNEKYLVNCSYNPLRTAISNHTATLKSILDLHPSNYKNILILGNFNVGVNEEQMKTFCETYNLNNLIKQPACYKNLYSPACINLKVHTQV